MFFCRVSWVNHWQEKKPDSPQVISNEWSIPGPYKAIKIIMLSQLTWWEQMIPELWGKKKKKRFKFHMNQDYEQGTQTLFSHSYLKAQQKSVECKPRWSDSYRTVSTNHNTVSCVQPIDYTRPITVKIGTAPTSSIVHMRKCSILQRPNLKQLA